MLDLLPFLCGACGCPYNDLVICKDSSDCLEDLQKNIRL